MDFRGIKFDFGEFSHSMACLAFTADALDFSGRMDVDDVEEGQEPGQR